MYFIDEASYSLTDLSEVAATRYLRLESTEILRMPPHGEGSSILTEILSSIFEELLSPAIKCKAGTRSIAEMTGTMT